MSQGGGFGKVPKSVTYYLNGPLELVEKNEFFNYNKARFGDLLVHKSVIFLCSLDTCGKKCDDKYIVL